MLLVPGNITRTGVFKYRTASGQVIRELRHPDDVFSEESLRTLDSAPVIHRHSTPDVTPENAAEHEIGVVLPGARRTDSNHIEAELSIRRAGAISGIKNGSLVELSAGYDCDRVMESGVFEGEPFDARQTNIVYNHVGVGPQDWARAGRTARLRLDSDDAVLLDDDDCQPVDPGGKDTNMHTIRLDGVDFEAPEQTVAAATKHFEAQAQKLEAVETEKAELSKRLDGLEAERDSLKADLEKANDSTRLDGLVAERVELERAAGDVLGDAPLAGLSAREVQEKTIAAIDAERKLDGKSDDYVAATFDILVASHKQAKAQAQHDGVASERRTDSADSKLVERLRAVDERYENAWKSGQQKGA